MVKLSILDMHTEAAPKDEKPTYHTTNKGRTLILDRGIDEGPTQGEDYIAFAFDRDEDTASVDNGGGDAMNEDATEKISPSKNDTSSNGKAIGDSSY
ncbi:hypothetical protein ACOSQ3_024528 [Xanthoceras sorbifolium]